MRPTVSVANILAVTVLTCSILMTACGSGSGSGGNSGGTGSGGPGGSGGTPPPPNPVPAITSLSPNSAMQGTNGLSITITGYNFLSTSGVQWNGSARSATYSSGTQLQVQLTAADIANPGSATVSVTNPTPGGGSSGSAEFTINPISNPAPMLQALTPGSVDAGSVDILCTVFGSNFIPTSVVQWNGAPLTTNYLSESYLVALVPASDLSNPELAEVVVVNPGPGGGTSAAVQFAVNGFAYAPLVVNQLANDMVWDPVNQVIYLSVPSTASSNGNTIATLNPSSGIIQSMQFAGSEPDVLAISDDSQFLYAGVDGSSSVQRFTLPGTVPDIDYSLGAGPYPFGPYFATYLQVAPGLPHTTAAASASFADAVENGCTNPLCGGAGEMAIFDDAVQTVVANQRTAAYDSPLWASGTQIYTIDNTDTAFDFDVLAVSPTAVTLSHNYPNDISEFYERIHYDSGTGYVYADDGWVINPANGKHVGQFQASGYMVPDSTLNSAFFLGQTQTQSGSTSFTIESFDLTTLAPLSEITIPYVAGVPLQFIRWGVSGLAFNDDAGFVYIINSSFVSANAKKKAGAARRNLFPVMRSWRNPTIRSRQKTRPEVRPRPKLRPRSMLSASQDSNPAPTIAALTPSSVIADDTGLSGFTLTVTGTNFVSLSTVEWNGSPRQTELVSSTELQAQINFQDVQNAGTASVSVSTPAPGGGTSSSLTFTMVQYSVLPVPYITGLNPNSAMAGSAGLLVEPAGLAISDSDTADWDGMPRTTTYQGALAVQVNASDLATPGYAEVTVISPSGAVSNGAPFQILYQPTAINQSTNDMVWDPVNQVFYISAPSSATTNANRVCVLNPATKAITNCQTGNEPDVLAISDDSEFLYVGMDGSGSVQRYDLPGLTPDISVSLQTSGSGPTYADDIQVAPGSPHTIAVTTGVVNLDPAYLGVSIYDDSVARPTSAPENDGLMGAKFYDSLQWGADDTTLYAANTEDSGFDFYTLTVNSSGVALGQDYPSVFWNPGNIHFDSGSGLVYSDDGFHAVNPSTGLPAGIFEVGGGWPMAPDSSLNSVFILSQYIWQENSNYTINIFDMTHYVPVGAVPFITTAAPGVNPLRRFIRWGSNGLAVNFVGDQVYLLSGSFVNAQNKSQIRKATAKNRSFTH